MEDRPKGFIIYPDDLEKTKRLSDTDFRAWVTGCLLYEETGELPDLSDMASLCFEFIKPRIDKDIEAYAKKCQINRENGKKGGRPPKPSKTHENPMGFLAPLENPRKPNNQLPINQLPMTNNQITTLSDSAVSGTKGESRGGQDVRSFCEQQLAGNLPPEIRELYSQWSEAVRCGDMKRGLDLDAALSRAGYVADPRTGQLSKRNSAQKVSCS